MKLVEESMTNEFEFKFYEPEKQYHVSRLDLLYYLLASNSEKDWR